jgi:hypothetical protein
VLEYEALRLWLFLCRALYIVRLSSLVRLLRRVLLASLFLLVVQNPATRAREHRTVRTMGMTIAIALFPDLGVRL